MIRLKRLGTSRYATTDERFLIEHAAVSTGEWDDDEMGWVVWDARVTPNLADVGIPDSIYEGDTLKRCRTFIEQRLEQEQQA